MNVETVWEHDCGWASAQINQGYFFTKTGDQQRRFKVHEISRLCLFYAAWL